MFDNIDNRDNKNNSSSNPKIQNKPEKNIERSDLIKISSLLYLLNTVPSV